MLRFFFLMILLAGIALGAGSFWIADNFSGREVGTYRSYHYQSGFKSFDVALKPSDAPVRIIVDLTTRGVPSFARDRAVLTLTVSQDGRTVATDTLTFSAAEPRKNAPQGPDQIYRVFAAPLTDVSEGSYTFTFGEGDAEGIDTRYVDVEIRANSILLDRRLQPLGIAMMAIGFIGMMVSARRRSKPDGQGSSEPPAPRWGRGADRN